MAWSLPYRAVRPAILPAPHSQPPGGVGGRNFRSFFKAAAVVRSKKTFQQVKNQMRGNLNSVKIRLLGLLLLFLITASGVFAFSATKSHQAKPAVSVETALKAIDFAAENDISIDSEFSANLRQGIVFTGRRYSSLTSQYFNRNRYYSPALGRFVSKDPISFSGGNNLYRYADNNPMLFVDPEGKFSIDPAVIAVYPDLNNEIADLQMILNKIMKNSNLKASFMSYIKSKEIKIIFDPDKGFDAMYNENNGTITVTK
ncbi:MAG: RHS repeat-associated core domain-containing protein, partial [Candidatus Riflebacteria bacterium]